MVEQILLHETNIALQLIRLHRIVFIQIKGNYVLERQPFFLMTPNQFFVDANGSTAGSKSKHANPVLSKSLANQVGNSVCNGRRSIARMFKNLDWNLLELVSCRVNLR